MTFQTAQRQYFFRNERWAQLLLEILQRYSTNYQLHDFVIMPDHVHLLLSPNVPLERAVQFIKGGFSFNARRMFDWSSDIWQVGFSDHRIRDSEDWQKHRAYIEKNFLSLCKEEYRFCGPHSGLPLSPSPQWLKPFIEPVIVGGAEAPPLQSAEVEL